MHLEHFDPNDMQDALGASTTTTEHLKQACFAYAQHRRFLPPSSRSALDQALINSPLQYANEAALAWVDSVFECLGVTGKEVLERYEIEPKAPGEARDYSGKKVSELRQEQLLPLVPESQKQTLWTTFHSSRLIQPDDLLGQVENHPTSLPDEVISHGYAPIAAPDCDGTLWYGDIGDLFFERALTERWLQPECAASLNRLCDQYGIRVHSNVNDTAKSMMDSRLDGEFLKRATMLGVEKNEAYRQFYSTQALCMAGLSVGFIKARTYEIMNEPGGLKEKIFPEVQALLHAFSRAGFVVVPISASLNLLVEVGVTFLGLPGRRALGVTTPHESGVLVGEMIEPMPYGQGKITLISQMGGLPPAVALGDSWQRTDKELLEGAGLGLVITHDSVPENLTDSLHCLSTPIPK